MLHMLLDLDSFMLHVGYESATKYKSKMLPPSPFFVRLVATDWL